MWYLSYNTCHTPCTLCLCFSFQTRFLLKAVNSLLIVSTLLCFAEFLAHSMCSIQGFGMHHTLKTLTGLSATVWIWSGPLLGVAQHWSTIQPFRLCYQGWRGAALNSALAAPAPQEPWLHSCITGGETPFHGTSKGGWQATTHCTHLNMSPGFVTVWLVSKL